MSAPPPELDGRVFGGWARSSHFDGTRFRYGVRMPGLGDVLETPCRQVDDFRLDDDRARVQLAVFAPELYDRLRAAAMALRSYQYGNGAPDLAAEIADAAEATLALARGQG